ncbi:MAG: galactose mutarotase [Anaerofustis stercorihominis]|nr:galactose mutarotase [Anaerofustis stercorihominis]
MSIRCEYFGKDRNNLDVLAFRLENAKGAYVRILNRGGIIQSICVPDKTGKLTNVVLGFDTMAEYDNDRAYLGALVGRVANRIADASFELNGKLYQLAANSPPNSIHGGVVGYTHRIWEHRIENNALVLTLHSPDGEEGFPGNLDVQVTYSFSDDCRLRIDYKACGDADTIVNLTNHAYFNLNGEGYVRNHILQIAADAYSLSGETLIPTGENASVTGTPFDFRKPKAIGADIGGDHPQLLVGKGYDHNYVLSAEKDCVKAYSPDTGISLTLSTDMPCMQLYTSNSIGHQPDEAGRIPSRFAGFCLETQYFPDAVHHPNFPSIVLKAGDVWDHYAEFAFGIV